MINAIENLGTYALNTIEQAGRTFRLLLVLLYKIVEPPYRFYPIVRQMHFIGARSLTLIVFSGLTIGMVLGLQFYNTLERFGSVDILGSAVALSVIRELGPVMTALMVVGRAGSAMCAELGIMRISEQVDALECMGIPPEKFLLAPKLLAGIVSVPLLTSVFSVVAIFGGYFVGVVLFGVSEGSYMNGMIDSVLWLDVRLGLVKSLIFGLLVTLICCAKGFYLHLEKSGSFGAEGVSKVTTDAVVISSVVVLFSDFLIGSLMQ
ncbi:MAG: MlaE family lipid ABC transporter permease subunit [Pseudomonadales bacterium]|nr:MlaE family lipid ABC transporter permease subunit [Pseudomonadales bacterium]